MGGVNVSQFLGALDARMPQHQTSLLDLAWYQRAGRLDMSHRRRYECQFGARNRFVTLWPDSAFMSGDRASGYCQIGQDAAEHGAWAPMQRANRGPSGMKFIMGQCKDANGTPLGGAIVQGFRTSNDQFVRETACDSTGRYELGTEYPGEAHYLVAYYDTTVDLAGTTVNTLLPTNRDGT